MTSPMVGIAAASEDLERALGHLQIVQLQHRTGARSPTTGQAGFSVAAPVEARIEGMDRLGRTAAGSVAHGKHVVTLYVPVEVGDRIIWGMQNHTVLNVDGLLEDVDGERYLYAVVTD